MSIDITKNVFGDSQVKIFIRGKPEPRGSKQSVPYYKRDQIDPKTGWPKIGVRVFDDNKKSGPWMAWIKREVAAVWDFRPLLTNPVRIDALFVMERPQYHYRTGKFKHLLRDDAPHYHTTKPDRGKLLRAVEDALTKTVYIDDGQSVKGDVVKIYGDKPGVILKITDLGENHESDWAADDGHARQAGLFNSSGGGCDETF